MRKARKRWRKRSKNSGNDLLSFVSTCGTGKCHVIKAFSAECILLPLFYRACNPGHPQRRYRMKRFWMLAVSGLCAALCTGCIDNYETREAGGKLYRINRRTGSVDLVDGNMLVRLSGTASAERHGIPSYAAAGSGRRGEGKMHRTMTDERTIAGYRKAGGATPVPGGRGGAAASYPLRCRLPAGTQIDGWFYKGGSAFDQGSWIPDTVLTDKQLAARPWELFRKPPVDRWSYDGDTLTSY
jgi:hypothetical protein